MSYTRYVVGWHVDADPCPPRRYTTRPALYLAWVLVALLGLALLLTPGIARAEDEPRFEPASRSPRQVVREIIAERAEANGVSVWAMDALAGCETGGTYNPNAVGDHGTSLGLMQLNTLPTGLYWHFLAVGYTDAFDAYQAADYVSRVAAGAFPGIRLSRWSCWRIVTGGGW